MIFEQTICSRMKIKLGSFKSSGHINEKRGGPYRGFGYLSLFSDPTDLATCSQVCKEYKSNKLGGNYKQGTCQLS